MNTAEKVKAPIFDASIDECIVQGYLDNRRAMMNQLKMMGFKRDAVRERARQLGLSKQFLRWYALGKPDVALRTCLDCGQSFLSSGFQNRMCSRCRHRG